MHTSTKPQRAGCCLTSFSCAACHVSSLHSERSPTVCARPQDPVKLEWPAQTSANEAIAFRRRLLRLCWNTWTLRIHSVMWHWHSCWQHHVKTMRTHSLTSQHELACGRPEPVCGFAICCDGALSPSKNPHRLAGGAIRQPGAVRFVTSSSGFGFSFRRRQRATGRVQIASRVSKRVTGSPAPRPLHLEPTSLHLRRKGRGARPQLADCRAASRIRHWAPAKRSRGCSG